VIDAWLRRDGQKLMFSLLMKYGEPTPYNIAAAAFGLGEADSRSTVCSLHDLYHEPPAVIDFFSIACADCGLAVPSNVLGKPADDSYCLKCKDIVEQKMVHQCTTGQMSSLISI
jgi:hypothetical protein